MRHQPTRDAEIIKRRTSGEMTRDICRAMKLSRGTVNGVLHRSGQVFPKPDRAKWKTRRGEDHPQSRLTTEQIAKIRASYVKHSHRYGSSPLARRYCVTARHIRKIVAGRSRRHG